MNKFLSLIFIFAVACSSASAPKEDTKPKTTGSYSSTSTDEANPCATAGATYLETSTEEAGGTCGAVSPQIITISQDGTLATSETCTTIMQTSCTAQDSGCVTTSNGVTCTSTTDVTFASDGSSASGLITLSCTEGATSCVSTYNVSIQRQ
jgi:hypothetical protein